MPTLVQIHPATEVREELLLAGREVVLGRGEDCAIHVKSDSVSRHHARVHNQGNAWFVEDLRSTNGCYLNDVLIERSVLREADVLKLGNVIFEFHLASGFETPAGDDGGGDHGSGALAIARSISALEPEHV